MTATLDRDSLDVEESPLLGDLSVDDTPPEDDAAGGGDDEVVVRTPLVALSAALATAAAAWVVTRLFRGGVTAPALALVGIGIGVGSVALGARLRSSAAQLAALPVAFVVAAIAATTAPGGEGTALPSLVVDALRGGGLKQPPIPFDPGWRFIVVMLFALTGAAAASLAIGLARPKLALPLPLAIALGGAVLQPEGSELLAAAPAVVLAVAALAVAYGADLSSAGVTDGGFELRRFARGAALLTVAIVALVALAQTDLLFPATDRDDVIPPQKPPTPPAEPDRELFRVVTDQKVPWRVGVLDEYGQNAFLLPSVDPARLVDVPDSGRLSPSPVSGTPETYTARVAVAQLKGQVLPAAPNETRVTGLDQDLQYDPRTQLAKLVDTGVPRGMRYTIEAPRPPDGPALAAAPAPAPAMRRFTQLPPPPPGVVALLAAADEATENRFDRLQFVRAALYSKVVAAGSGKPIDILPGRVDDLLAGDEATPYEITAAEVMLARWAGIPARIGFGFYQGEAVSGGAVAFRPKHGAAWLEAYFEGHGWIPILGTPPRAKPSISNDQQKDDPDVLPTDELALTVFVPVRLQSIRLLYEQVRYYASLVLPAVLLLVALVAGYPAAVKAARTRRRRRWALERGPRHRVTVAYAELRDRLHDLNVGTTRATPLELVALVEDDDEHAELAWLVTRALWGDLVRDLRAEDVEDAEEMAASVMRRIHLGQSGTTRLLARISRASLRDPWTDEVPNLWRTKKARAARRSPGRIRVLNVRRRRLAAAAGVVAVVLGLGSCGNGDGVEAFRPTYPDPLLPPDVLGYTVERVPGVEDEYKRPQDAALVSEGRVFTVRENETIQGSIQVAAFKPSIDPQKRKVQEGVERGLGSSQAFRTVRLGTIRLRRLDLPEQTVYLWFPPERDVMELFVFRKRFGDAPKVVREIVRHQRTGSADSPEPPAVDPPKIEDSTPGGDRP